MYTRNLIRTILHCATMAAVVLLVSGCNSGSGSTVITTVPRPLFLTFTAQPSRVNTGEAISPAVEVGVIDASGNPVTNAALTITLELDSNPADATLGGTTEIEMEEGHAVFEDLTLDKAGAGYTLRASAEGAASAVSEPFDDVRVLSFAPPTTLAANTPIASQTLASADFNGDGNDDLVAVDTNQVRVFISNGDGTFQAGAPFATAASPAAVTTADLTGDGNIDLAVACQTDVSFLEGNGDGTFQPRVDVATGAATTLRGICAGRFIAPPLLDIAVSDPATGSVYVYQNQGALAFTVQAFGGNGTLPNPRGIAAGDLNGDGVDDIAVANVAQAQAVWTNSASSTLASLFPNTNKTTVNLDNPGGASQAVVLGDWTTPGRADLFCPDTVPVGGENQGNFFQNFGALAPPALLRVGQDPFGAAAADFNLDGINDIGVSTAFGLADLTGDLEVLLGLGDGAFDAVQVFRLPDGNTESRAMTVGDFNGDGLPDAAVSGGPAWIFLNTSQ